MNIFLIHTFMNNMSNYINIIIYISSIKKYFSFNLIGIWLKTTNTYIFNTIINIIFIIIFFYQKLLFYYHLHQNHIKRKWKNVFFYSKYIISLSSWNWKLIEYQFFLLFYFKFKCFVTWTNIKLNSYLLIQSFFNWFWMVC